MAGYEEYVEQEHADMGRLLAKVEALCSESTWHNLSAAAEAGITPTEQAYRTVEREAYGD
jgi:hypothetical protein